MYGVPFKIMCGNHNVCGYEFHSNFQIEKVKFIWILSTSPKVKETFVIIAGETAGIGDQFL